MPDIEMVVRCFEFCRVEDKCSTDCQYWDNDGSARKCTKELAKDVLTLLKEQEAKTGKWIPVTNGRGGMECSICHDYAPSYQNGTEYLSKYCPRCGAKMEFEGR